MKQRKWKIIFISLFSCVMMAAIELLWKPNYFYKSICKIGLFGGTILWMCLKEKRSPSFFFKIQNKRQLLKAILLAVAVYVLILFVYGILGSKIDFSQMLNGLSQKEGISAKNFIWVTLYISCVNSLLEELLFRGYAYGFLKEDMPEWQASLFSAGLFAIYHVAIMVNWFSIWLFLLLLAGLFVAGLLFNYLDHEGGILPSWLLHISANLAINTIGCLLVGVF